MYFPALDYDENIYLLLMEHLESLEPGKEFKGVKLKQGWLVKTESNKEKNSTVTWYARNKKEIKKDHLR